MAPVTYFVRMIAKEGQADEVLELLLENPNEFWLYETWESEEAVEAHESGDAFASYKERLRPLVDPDSVIYGNCEPLKVLGYDVPG